MTATITKQTRGKIELVVGPVLDYLAAIIPGYITRRSAKGISSDGTPFRPYSDLYAMQLRSVGESDAVDLTRSGDYLASISERSRTITPTGGRLLIGPGTGTSRHMPLPPPYVFSQSKTPQERAEAFADWKAAPKAQKRSPPHNVLGRILEKGNGKIAPRPHLGLTPEERKRIAADIAKFAIRQGR
jgi:hypothetical protein